MPQRSRIRRRDNLMNGMAIWRVAVPSPLYKTFDYLPASNDGPAVRPGMRVRVPFGHTTKIGLITGTARGSVVAGGRLKRAHELLDEEPVFSTELWDLLCWAATYYHHPLGEVLLGSLPGLLRRGAQAQGRSVRRWRLTEAGRRINPETLRRAPRQRKLLQQLGRHPGGAGPEEFDTDGPWLEAMRRLIEKGWATMEEVPAPPPPAPDAGGEPPPPLNPSQRAAVKSVISAAGRYRAFLLDGVTGSGKTEVYFNIIEALLPRGLQALVLVPEIGLTPQLIQRFRRRFSVPLAVLHSGLSDRERLDAWLMAKQGQAPIVIGTRSAVFTPLARPGAFIVDEEHDTSYKQQDGFRYHARDIAVARARRLNVPVVLGSATPSLESLYNCEQGRYQRLVLATRAGSAAPPHIQPIDMRREHCRHGLSGRMVRAIAAHLERGNQVLLFLNRRGYAPTLLCQDCGWVAACRRCDAHLILHRAQNVLRCHHCDARLDMITDCAQCGGSDLRPLGQGTERVEEVLASRFPHAEVVRIDRDSTRRKGAMQDLIEHVRHGKRQILLGTQMLTKGHHLPNVTLVGILDADRGLFGADFRSSERTGQLITQVAGRAGRANKPGEVLIQTRYPDHPLLTRLLSHDYYTFARGLLEERRQATLPPYGCLALLRAESVKRTSPVEFLTAAREYAAGLGVSGVELLGPAPALMERKAGRYRAQLMLQAARRGPLHRLLDTLAPRLDTLRRSRGVRWSLDVDPMEEF